MYIRVGEFFSIIFTGFFVKWGIDAVGLINFVTVSGMKYIFTVIDYCIRWVEAEAVSVIIVDAAAEFLYRNIMIRYGCFSEIV